MSDRVFEVTYRVGMSDLNAFFGVWLRRTWFDKTNWRRFGIYALAIEALMLVFTWPTLTGQTINSAYSPVFAFFLTVFEIIVSLILAFGLAFLLSPLLTYLVQMFVFTVGPMRKRVSRLRATTAGIDKITDETESQTGWRDFTAIVDTQKTVLLFTHRNSATIIPKLAFASPAEAEAFAAFATAQWGEVRSVF